MMRAVLLGALAGLISSSVLAQAPDLSGKDAFVVNPHDLVCVTSEGVIVRCPQPVPGLGTGVVDRLGHADVPTSADQTCFPGQGSEWEQRSQPSCGEVTILRGSR
jgi:hypothetical protein